MLERDRRANVQPSSGVKQGCPLFPLLFSIHLNDVDSLAEGVQGVITGIPDFTVTHMLFSDYLFLTSYADHNKLQTMLNKLRAYSQKNLMAVNTQTSKVMCFNSRFGSCLLPFFWGGTQLP